MANKLLFKALPMRLISESSRLPYQGRIFELFLSASAQLACLSQYLGQIQPVNGSVRATAD